MIHPLLSIWLEPCGQRLLSQFLACYQYIFENRPDFQLVYSAKKSLLRLPFLIAEVCHGNILDWSLEICGKCRGQVLHVLLDNPENLNNPGNPRQFWKLFWTRKLAQYRESRVNNKSFDHLTACEKLKQQSPAFFPNLINLVYVFYTIDCLGFYDRLLSGFKIAFTFFLLFSCFWDVVIMAQFQISYNVVGYAIRK